MKFLKQIAVRLGLLLPDKVRKRILGHALGQKVQRFLASELNNSEKIDLANRVWLLEQTVDSLLVRVIELSQEIDKQK